MNLSDMKGKPGIYRLLHVSTKKFYVGSSKNLYRRYHEHMSSLRRGAHSNPELQKLFVSDTNVIFVASMTDTHEEAFSKETEEILLNKDNPNCLNNVITVTPFSSARNKAISAAMMGHPVSEKTRKAIGEAAKGNTYWLGRKHRPESLKKMAESTKGNSYAKGHKKTPEGIEKIRQAHLGRNHSEEVRLKVSLNSAKAKKVSVDGIVYRNQSIAGKALGVSGDTVRRRCLSPAFENYSYVQ